MSAQPALTLRLPDNYNYGDARQSEDRMIVRQFVFINTARLPGCMSKRLYFRPLAVAIEKGIGIEPTKTGNSDRRSYPEPVPVTGTGTGTRTCSTPPDCS